MNVIKWKKPILHIILSFQLYDTQKGKTMETERSVVEWAEMGRYIDHRRFLVWWKYSVGYHNNGYIS